MEKVGEYFPPPLDVTRSFRQFGERTELLKNILGGVSLEANYFQLPGVFKNILPASQCGKRDHAGNS